MKIDSSEASLSALAPLIIILCQKSASLATVALSLNEEDKSLVPFQWRPYLWAFKIAFDTLRDCEAAHAQLRSAADIVRSLGERDEFRTISNNYYNVSVLLFKRRDYERALTFAQQARSLFTEWYSSVDEDVVQDDLESLELELSNREALVSNIARRLSENPNTSGGAKSPKMKKKPQPSAKPKGDEKKEEEMPVSLTPAVLSSSSCSAFC